MLRRLLPFIPLIFFIACGTQSGVITDSIVTAVLQTQTASIWTLTPSTTPEPKTGKIVDALNNVLVGADPLGETIAARYKVIDVQVMTEPPTNLSGTLRIQVDCEWNYSDSCTIEESFVRVMNALRTNDNVKARITENVPNTVHTLQVVFFDRMVQKGTIAITWNDVTDYMNEKINGTQLGARIIRMVTP